MPKFYFLLGFSLLVAGLPAGAAAEANREPAEVNATFGPSPDHGDTICPMIEAAARVHGLPIDFFTRVIWQESRFRPDEIGPVTRSGARAQGIAQFMPGTAAERGLVEPFNPVEALPKSGEFLAELRERTADDGELKILFHEQNQGKGGARVDA